MGYKDEIRDALKQFVKDCIVDVSLQAVVKSVDQDNKTCEVTIEKQSLSAFSVRLMAVAEDLAGKGVLIIPKVGSVVQITMIDGVDTAYYISKYSDIDSVLIDIENMSLKMDANGIVMNDGGLGGIPKIEVLEDNLNALKNYCEALKAAVSAGLSAVGAGSAANGGTGASTFNSNMASQTITFNDMEDQNVKH